MDDSARAYVGKGQRDRRAPVDNGVLAAKDDFAGGGCR
jgi:hypothetical protein